MIKDDHVMAMGGLESVDFSFSNIRMELDTGRKSKNGDKTRLLIDGSVSGRAKPGRMLAIMGPSGAGKVRRELSTDDIRRILRERGVAE